MIVITIVFLHHQKLLIGVKGRVQTRVFETEDEKKKYVTEVVAEKVSFLSPSHKAEE